MNVVYHTLPLLYNISVKIIAKNEADLAAMAVRIAKKVQPSDVITLSGPLASGKTTLTQHILRAMGYAGWVSSPTFVIENRYPVNWQGITTVLHLDLYRLTEKDLPQLDWADYTEADRQLTIIEWPDVAKGLLPPEAKTISIRIIDAKTREFTLPDALS